MRRCLGEFSVGKSECSMINVFFKAYSPRCSEQMTGYASQIQMCNGSGGHMPTTLYFGLGERNNVILYIVRGLRKYLGATEGLEIAIRSQSIGNERTYSPTAFFAWRFTLHDYHGICSIVPVRNGNVL